MQRRSVLLIAWAVIVFALVMIVAVEAWGQEAPTVVDCSVSGRGAGTLITVPTTGEWAITVDTVNGQKEARQTILAQPGETWTITYQGDVWDTGEGIATGCNSASSTTTAAPTTTTILPETTTTLRRACDEVECPTTTRSEQSTTSSPVTTSTVSETTDWQQNITDGQQDTSQQLPVTGWPSLALTILSLVGIGTGYGLIRLANRRR